MEACPLQRFMFVEVIVSVGGEDDKVVLRSVEFWDPATKVRGSWLTDCRGVKAILGSSSHKTPCSNSFISY